MRVVVHATILTCVSWPKASQLLRRPADIVMVCSTTYTCGVKRKLAAGAAGAAAAAAASSKRLHLWKHEAQDADWPAQAVQSGRPQGWSELSCGVV